MTKNFPTLMSLIYLTFSQSLVLKNFFQDETQSRFQWDTNENMPMIRLKN